MRISACAAVPRHIDGGDLRSPLGYPLGSGRRHNNRVGPANDDSPGIPLVDAGLDRRVVTVHHFDQAWQDYRQHTLYGRVRALNNPRMQPRERINTMAERHITTIDDHNSVVVVLSDPRSV